VRSAVIDGNGCFRFPNIAPGKYLLRISPEPNSETARKFQPSWYDQDDDQEKAQMVIMGSRDMDADVHLLKRP
jgi:hypothetical protein